MLFYGHKLINYDIEIQIFNIVIFDIYYCYETSLFVIIILIILLIFQQSSFFFSKIFNQKGGELAPWGRQSLGAGRTNAPPCTAVATPLYPTKNKSSILFFSLRKSSFDYYWEKRTLHFDCAIEILDKSSYLCNRLKNAQRNRHFSYAYGGTVLRYFCSL